MRRRIAALRRDERGYSLIELIISMTLLAAIMTSVSVLLISATKSELDMNKRFQAQTSARLGLDRLRREVHCAQSVVMSGTAVAGSYPNAKLNIPSTCPTAGGLTEITWCTRANGNRWELWRYESATCNTGAGRKWADHLAKPAIFSYTVQSPSTLAKLRVQLPVSVPTVQNERAYVLDDDIVLRNSVRATPV